MNGDKAIRRKGRDSKEARHVRLYHYLLHSAAWRSLDAVSRAVYIEIAARYAGTGSNNGRIGYSVREAAESLGIGRMTAARALTKLQERGFIVAMQRGTFNRKVRHCTEWRLTEYGCDCTHALATKDFMKWSPERKITVPPQTRTVSQEGPIGIRGGTDAPKIAAHGI
jgi:DNA-binding transcriptional MocR family regulator